MAAPVPEDLDVNFSTGDTTSVVGDLPPDAADDEMLLAVLHLDGNPNVDTVPTNWTEITDAYAVTGSVVSHRVYWKNVPDASAEPATYTWELDAGQQHVVSIHRISGHDSANPINAADKDQTGANSTTSTSPSVTTTVDNCLIFYIASWDGQRNPFTPPSGTTELYEANSTGAGRNSGTAAWKNLASAGASGTGVFTSTTSDNQVASTIAIAPAVAAGSTPVLSLRHPMRNPILRL